MRHSKLFRKTFILTLCTIVGTFLILGSLFMISLESILKNTSQNYFDNAANEIIKEVKNNGLKADNLYLLERKFGVSILIKDEKKSFIYPEIKMNDIIEPSTDKNEVVFSMDDNNTDLSKELSMKVNNKLYQISISYKNSVTSMFTLSLFTQVLPYIIGVGILISILAAYIYSRMSIKRIERINHNMEAMKALDYIPKKINNSDELTQLQIDIDNLYTSLLDKIRVVGALEKDRELFMRGAIHELKTPIMSISLVIDGILEKDSTNCDALIVKQKLVSMSRLINEILNVSKIEWITEESHAEVIPIIDNLLENYKELIEDMDLKVRKEIYPVNTQLRQAEIEKIISNLLSNAIKYNVINGNIVVKSDGNIFSITNTTKEIEHDDILNPFVSYSNSDELTSHGLGLYIVTKFLDNHHLEYNYEYKKNTFTFTFYWNA